MKHIQVDVAINSFSLLLNVDVQQSRDFTLNLAPPTGKEYCFVRADLFMVVEGRKVPVLMRDQLGNATKFLSLLKQRLENPKMSALPEGIIQPGGLGKWLDEYFLREVDNATNKTDDENYSLINDKALAADNNGLIGVYSLGDAVFVEVWICNRTTHVSSVWWQECDPLVLCKKVDRAIQACRAAID